MPRTRDRVQACLTWLESRNVGPVVLLVVPDTGWDADGIEWLRALTAAGHELAGHGWRHRITGYGGLYHRLHAAFISRDVAEHLALNEAEVRDLVRRCHAWFGDAGLEAPRLYVPPAWAMGPLHRASLEDLPFEWYEDLGGYRRRDGTRLDVPVLGFEADRAWTRPFLKAFNGLARYRARGAGLLRIAIHPHDLWLPMSDDLAACFDDPAGAGPRPLVGSRSLDAAAGG
jgi:predicted deacetylase